MSLRGVLDGMLDRTPGAVLAAFLDQEGETIEYATRDASRHDARVFGAYLGIFLNRARILAAGLLQDTPQRMTIEWSRLTGLTSTLRDGYYVVLVVRTPTAEAIALRNLDLACRELEKELL